MSEQGLALTMVVTLFATMMLGFPVAFTLAGVAILFGTVGKVVFLDYDYLCADLEIIQCLSEQIAVFDLLPLRIWGVITNITLLAVPLFIFMGVALERSGVAEHLLEAMTLMFGRLRAGMALSVIIAGAFLAASTGIVGASVVTMGLICLPVMLKNGFKPAFSTGVICASGTLGQIIPPSIVLILLGDIMGVSVGELFMAAVIPGLLLVFFYFLYSLTYVYFFSGTLSVEEKEFPAFREFCGILLRGFVPPAVLIVLVLGSIFWGVASPTEAASVGAFGALVIAFCQKRLSWKVLKEVMFTSLELTTMVFLILLGASAFGLVFRELSGDEAIRQLVLGLSEQPSTFIFMVMLLMFVLGCFLDFIEIIFIVVPILVPLIQEFQLNPLWFAVVIAINLQMSFLTPPFGFSLFYLKGVCPPEIKTTDIYKGIIPFVVIQAIVLALILFFPELALWLPRVLAG